MTHSTGRMTGENAGPDVTHDDLYGELAPREMTWAEISEHFWAKRRHDGWRYVCTHCCQPINVRLKATAGPPLYEHLRAQHPDKVGQ